MTIRALLLIPALSTPRPCYSLLAALIAARTDRAHVVAMRKAVR
jgi:hypothetical protein